VVLEWETQEVTECEHVLVMCIDGETGVDHSSWGVLYDGVGKGVVKASPVCECVGPSVDSHEVLPVDRCGDSTGSPRCRARPHSAIADKVRRNHRGGTGSLLKIGRFS
jgi:hypothetical protein